MLVSWFRDGVPVESSESIRITRIDEVTSLLAISDLSSHQAGNYSCVAKNEVAVVSVTASLVVRGNPHCTLSLHAALSAPAQLVGLVVPSSVKNVSTTLDFSRYKYTFLTFLSTPRHLLYPNVYNFLRHKLKC